MKASRVESIFAFVADEKAVVCCVRRQLNSFVSVIDGLNRTR